MMRNLLCVLIIVIFTGVIRIADAQENIQPKYETVNGKTYILHPVVAGETLYSIGKKYNIDPLEIVNNNPQLVSGLKAGDVLRISDGNVGNAAVGKAESPIPKQFIIHSVQRRETLYSISRQYQITIDDILKYNPGLTQLRRGDKIQIPVKETIKTEPVTTTKEAIPDIILHEVIAGETLFAISRKYGVTVQQIHELNPDIAIIQPGMKLRIPGKSGIIEPEEPMSKGVKSYIQHTIAPGETLFSLSRKYNVSAEELIALNPSLDGAFKAGTIIQIPVQPEEKKDAMIRHTVIQGETLFGIAQRYNVKTTDIEKWNPFLAYRSIIVGDILNLIPGEPDIHAPAQPLGDDPISSAECANLQKNRQPGQTIDVVLLLPLMLESNLSNNNEQILSGFRNNVYQEISPDSVQIIRNERGPQIRFQGNSENFIHFYEGALLAIDTLIKRGVKVNLRVFDTEQRESRVRQLIVADKLRNADLIIGPVYPNEQKDVAEYALKNRIPIISPLSASDDITKVNPWYFQINTPRETINELTANYVAETYPTANYIVLRTGNQGTAQDNEMVRLIREKVTQRGSSTIHSCDFQKTGLAGLRQLVVPDRKNVVILTSSNEAEVSVGLSNLHTLASGHDITVIGTNRFIQFESINNEYFHDGQLEFLAPYWPDYSKEVTKSFVRNFRNHFKTEPNQFSMQGYDVTFFFITAINEFGPDFRNCLQYNNPQLVQGNYKFEKLPSGGFVNKGLNVVRFTRDYRIISSAASIRK